VRWLSLSIAELMVIVVLVALDCLAIRVGSPLTFYALVFGGLLMQGALVAGLIRLARRRTHREKTIHLFTRFVVAGLICHLAYLAICVLAAEPLTWHLTYTLGPIVEAIGFQHESSAEQVCKSGIAMVYLTLLQLIPALVGGWIFHWWSKQTGSERPLSRK
jgi:hypothetical protein